MQPSSILVLDDTKHSCSVRLHGFILLFICIRYYHRRYANVTCCWKVGHFFLSGNLHTRSYLWHIPWIINPPSIEVDYWAERSSQHKDYDHACVIIRNLYAKYNRFSYSSWVQFLGLYLIWILLGNWHLHYNLLLLDASNDLLDILEYG